MRGALCDVTVVFGQIALIPAWKVAIGDDSSSTRDVCRSTQVVVSIDTCATPRISLACWQFNAAICIQSRSTLGECWSTLWSGIDPALSISVDYALSNVDTGSVSYCSVDTINVCRAILEINVESGWFCFITAWCLVYMCWCRSIPWVGVGRHCLCNYKFVITLLNVRDLIFTSHRSSIPRSC